MISISKGPQITKVSKTLSIQNSAANTKPPIYGLYQRCPAYDLQTTFLDSWQSNGAQIRVTWRRL